jgi:hypothetical protein
MAIVLISHGKLDDFLVCFIEEVEFQAKQAVREMLHAAELDVIVGQEHGSVDELQ